MGLRSQNMKADNSKWLLEGMKIDRFDWYIGDLQNWRENKCNQMLAIIDSMMQAELHRRIKNADV